MRSDKHLHDSFEDYDKMRFFYFSNQRQENARETEKENTNDEYDDRLSKRKTSEHRTVWRQTVIKT